MDVIRSRISLVWAILVGATVLSWEFGHGVGFDEQRLANAAIIVIAIIKVRYVILDFMEIRHAPLWMRGIAECWALAVCIGLVGLYFHGS